MKRLNLFEYSNTVQVPNRDDLESHLISIRQEFDKFLSKQETAERQYFLSFDGDKARANNFVGFIQTNDCQIDIYPKVFREQALTDENKLIFNHHLFHWLSYSRTWRFPFTKNQFDSTDISDLPELLINLMSTEILKVVAVQPIALYEPAQISLQKPKGRINFSRYLNRGFISGNHHILECDYSPFQYDNSLNRIIKYVARLLERKAKHRDTLDKLSEIVFVLDEVADIPCTVNDLNKVKLNTHYNEYYPVIDICRIVLNQQVYSHTDYEQSHWCMLLPMELIFEEYIAKFIEENFPDWIIEYQKSEKYLVNNPLAFQLQHDILITNKRDKSLKVIIDTKYKLRSSQDLLDNKKGIVQSDMYQMVSYAYRRGCANVLMLYPNTSTTVNDHTFIIESGFAGDDTTFNITVADVPIWSMKNYSKSELDANLFTAIQLLLEKYK